MSIVASFPFYLLCQLQDSNSDATTKELRDSLVKELTVLQAGIGQGLSSTEPVSFAALAETNIELLFSMRIRALKWLAGQVSPLEQLYESTELALVRPKGPEQDGLEQLYTDVRFALWGRRRLLQEADNARAIGVAGLERDLQGLERESLSYGLYQSLLLLTDSPQTLLHAYFYLLRQSLLLEYGLVAAGQVLRAPQGYEPARVAELSGFLAQAAGAMGACALQLGLLKGASGAADFKKLSAEEIFQEQERTRGEFNTWFNSIK